MNQRCNRIIQQVINNLLTQHPEIGTKRSWIRGIIPRMKIVTLVYACIVDSNIWHKGPEEMRTRITREARGDMDTLLQEFRAYKSENKDAVKEFIAKNWKELSEFIQANAPQMIVNILGDIGFNNDFINAAFTDAQFAESRLADPGTHAQMKQFKRRIKLTFDKAFDGIKANYLKAAYGIA